jgi:Endonuclease/Exonuclease/phosphatase family/RhoGAP domain
MAGTRRALRLFAGTWNVNGLAPEPALDLVPWLLPPPPAPPHDLYMLGFQEVQSLSGVDAVRTDGARGFAWRYAVEKLLAPRGLVLVAERQLVGILVVVFVRHEHSAFVGDVRVSYAGTGFLSVGGNKGAVAARFRLYDRTVSCVSCHLSAHDGNLERRNSDFRDIVSKAMFASPERAVVDAESAASTRSSSSSSSVRSGLAARLNASGLGSSSASSPSGAAAAAQSAQQWIGSFATAAAVVLADVNAGANSVLLNDPNALNILDHDAVFWLGDMNYRIDAPPETVVKWIETADWEALCAADQLCRQMAKVPAFQGFYEGPICFAPTYKFDRYVDRYSRDEATGALKRTPAYTDRIMWRCGFPEAAPAARPDLQLLRYTSAKVYSSDHRPVSATFSMTFMLDDEVRERAANAQPPKGGSTYPRSASPAAALAVLGGGRPGEAAGQQALRPSIRLSSRELSLGTVLYERRALTKLVLTNDGEIPVALSFRKDCFPSWLSLSDRRQQSIAVLQVNESVTVAFQVLVTAAGGCAADLAFGEMRLEATLAVDLNRGVGGRETFVVKGRYPPTCLGASLDSLAMCDESVTASVTNGHRPRGRDGAAHAGATESAAEQEQRAAPTALPLPCPKEIWWLIDLLWRSREDADDRDNEDRRRWIDQDRFRRVFLATGDLEVVDIAQERIDCGLAMPPEVDALAVATCLLNLLRSLEEPVIPFAAYADAIEVAKKREPRGVTALLHRIPSLYGNVFRYIIGLLRELPAVRDGSGTSDIADIFGEILLAPSIDRPARDLRERAMFVRLALSPEFVPCNMTVVDIARSSLSVGHTGGGGGSSGGTH